MRPSDVLYCVVLCCVVVCCVVLYCVVLCCIVLYCVVLCCIVLYCVVLCCIVLYCVVLIFLKDTSQRGSDIRRFGSTTAAFISDYNDTYKQVYK